MKRPLTVTLLPLLILVALLAAGCGGGSNEEAPAGEGATGPATTNAGTTLQLAADPSGKLEFDKTTLEAPAGEMTIVLTNDSSVPHNVVIEGNGVEEGSDTIAGGKQASVTADLEPGTYTFYCSVPGHEAAGMKGTLTVSG